MIDKLALSLPGMRALLARASIITALAALCIIGFSWALATALSNLWHGEPAADQLPWLALILCCATARRSLGSWLDGIAASYARTAAARLRRRLLERAMSEGARFTSSLGSAAVAASAMEGADTVETYLRIWPPRLVSVVVIPLAILLFVFPFDWVSGLIALIAFPFIVLYMVMLGATAKTEARRRLAQFDALANHFLDSIRGLRTLQLFGRVEDRARSTFETSERFRLLTMKTLRTATLSGAVLDLFSTGSLAAIAIMLGFRLVDGDLALFPALLVLVIVPEYFRPVREFASDYHATLDGKSALDSLCALVDAPESPLATADIEPWGASSTLELENVRITCDGYAPLDGATLSFTGYERVALVGASGAGKSTLARLIAGFEDPDGGAIRVNGNAVSTLRASTWLSQVVFIPQNPYLFHATLRDNIAFYRPEASSEDVRGAVRAAGLQALVDNLPEGLDTVIGEGGRALSGGEAQRVAIARALVDKTRGIIVFDEPTAHLDVETEYELKQRMLPLMENRLVLFATHRLHWLDCMDTVIVLENGKAVSQGAPFEVDLSCVFGESANALSKARAWCIGKNREKRKGVNVDGR